LNEVAIRREEGGYESTTYVLFTNRALYPVTGFVLITGLSRNKIRLPPTECKPIEAHWTAVNDVPMFSGAPRGPSEIGIPLTFANWKVASEIRSKKVM
jgi:hypothetical protein